MSEISTRVTSTRGFCTSITEAGNHTRCAAMVEKRAQRSGVECARACACVYSGTPPNGHQSKFRVPIDFP